jgi:hypothetical protein
MDQPPPDAFLEAYPADIRADADRLRSLVKRAAPGVVERVRLGWRLIGYDLPHGRRRIFFAYVAPEPIHTHLGFEYGAWMEDRERRLEGAHLRLKKVRYLTFNPGDEIPEQSVLELTREAARVATMTPSERMAQVLDGAWAPR